jgi:NADP-dependent aldehyde dehydrogenase
MEQVLKVTGVEIRGGSPNPPHVSAERAAVFEPGHAIKSSAALLRTGYDVFRRSPTLRDEVFGPALIAVVCDNEDQVVEAASAIQGSLTGTIWASGTDGPLAARVQGVLEQRVGRLIYNGVPTGVEVCWSMQHGGPYPATNHPHTTAVGPFAIRRWCRPICYQNTPDAFLPPALRNANPLGILRREDGELTREGVGGKG